MVGQYKMVLAAVALITEKWSISVQCLPTYCGSSRSHRCRTNVLRWGRSPSRSRCKMMAVWIIAYLLLHLLHTLACTQEEDCPSPLSPSETLQPFRTFEKQQCPTMTMKWIVNCLLFPLFTLSPLRSKVLQWFQPNDHVFLEQHTGWHRLHNICWKTFRVRKTIHSNMAFVVCNLGAISLSNSW